MGITLHADVAQPAEQLIRNQQVASSILAIGSSNKGVRDFL
ncbi:MAG: hypothetical protein QG555_408 [Thermodesulfobacteriota bacterium]|nr:hypothetical protein [Thermodesulfobacteriota bacterium]